MAKDREGPRIVQIPKDAIKKADLGQSFAEYDFIRTDPQLVVETPAIVAASGRQTAKCIFVGRRGAGKTAITYNLEQKDQKRTILLLPQLFSTLDQFVTTEATDNIHQRSFKTLVSSFKKSLMCEVVLRWSTSATFAFRNSSAQSAITRERNLIEQNDFDMRSFEFAKEGFNLLEKGREKDWHRYIQRTKELSGEVQEESEEPRRHLRLLIDRIDEDWTGSDNAVVLLMALMHACVELNAVQANIRLLLFVRENMFDRVRKIDSEWSRIETAILSLEWTRESLKEFVERRLRRSLITKPALGGPTWDAFFEPCEGESTEDMVFNFCQPRPRDVLTYCSFALSNAQAHHHTQIMVSDLKEARKKFSESRLKELCDEYADNYPQMDVVLFRFYGLGEGYTIKAIGDFIRKLMLDPEVKQGCAKWIFQNLSPYAFVSLLYGIGFLGIKEGKGPAYFKLQETQSFSPSNLTDASVVVIHETYREALQLQNVLVTELDETTPLKPGGLVVDLPDSYSAEMHRSRLLSMQATLPQIKKGSEQSGQFEDFVGDLIKLCFFRSLGNVEPKVRNLNGRNIKDWVAGNHATGGFWADIRNRYKAMNVIFECKNYESLHADDFAQAAYYMNNRIGNFCVVLYRGRSEIKTTYYEHIREIASKHDGMILLFGERDLEILLRQAINRKNSEPHIRETLDRIIRKIA